MAGQDQSRPLFSAQDGKHRSRVCGANRVSTSGVFSSFLPFMALSCLVLNYPKTLQPVATPIGYDLHLDTNASYEYPHSRRCRHADYNTSASLYLLPGAMLPNPESRLRARKLFLPHNT